uniref:Uncharacterized protein n=1 Tax=Arundo donax TaxID=35708 RepID=A0A0A9ER52_ARUDO
MRRPATWRAMRRRIIPALQRSKRRLRRGAKPGRGGCRWRRWRP